LFDNITHDDSVIESKIEKAIGTRNTYRFFSELVRQRPTIVIIVEKIIKELYEAVNLYENQPIEIREFRIFKKLDDEKVQAYLFEPVYISPNLPTTTTRPENLTVQSTETPSPRERHSSAISIIDLLNSKRIQANQIIFGENKGKLYTGKILENGKVWVDDLGRDFDSLSGAAIKAKNVESEDGWRWWYIKNKNGEKVTFAALRENYNSSRV
jgi:hypothetical protein